ncbi:MAG: PDZ domain-containing protein, partial [Myxococcota bacterium]
NTSGGSSGSPVVVQSGDVIALNAGSRTSTASAFYLPLDRIVRAIPFIEAGEIPPRGTLQATFSYTPYDEVRRLGVSDGAESAARSAFPDAIGMLVVSDFVPGGPAEGVLRPGDVLVSLQGKPVASFIGIERVLDDSVGKSISLGLERGGKAMDVELTVDDLHAISPDTYLEAGRGVFTPVSYMQARNHHLPVEGVYVTQAGYSFSRGGLPSQTVLTSVDGVDVPDLDALQKELSTKADGDSVRLRYYPVSDPQRTDEAVVTMDRKWHAMRRCTRDPKTGVWPCEDVPEPSKTATASSGTVTFPPAQTRPGKALAHSLVQVDFDVPYPTTGIKAANYRGVGIIVDAERGLVVCDRDTVPVRIGDIELTFAGQLRVPAQVRYLHPVHNLAVLSYDPSLLGDSDVRSAEFVERTVESGDRIWQIGLSSGGELVEYQTQVAKTGALTLGASRTPRFRDFNVEGFSLTDTLSSMGGVMADKKGRVVAAWLSFMDQRRGEARFRAMPSVFLSRVIEPLRRGEDPDYRALGAELRPLGLADARERGLSDAWAARILRADPQERKVLAVERVFGATPAQSLLKNGDLVLEINGQTRTRLSQVEALTDRAELNLTVLRDGKEMALTVPTVAVNGNGTDRLVQWAGLIVHEPHLEVAFQQGKETAGVYGTWIWYGTPAYDSQIRPTRHIVEIDGTPITDMDSFVEVVRGLSDRQAVRVGLERLDGRTEVRTMKMDLHYWPTTEVRWDGTGFKRTEIEGAAP